MTYTLEFEIDEILYHDHGEMVPEIIMISILLVISILSSIYFLFIFLRKEGFD